MKPRNRPPLIFLSLIFFTFIILIIIIVNSRSTNQPVLFKPAPSLTPTPDPLAPKNILILGYSGGKHDGSLLTDTIIVAHIEPKNKKVMLISIPRDIWVSLPIDSEKTKNYKINAAFAVGSDDRNFKNKPKEYQGIHGGGNLAKNTLSEVTGLPIQSYIAIDFDGFEKIIEILGDVTISVPQAFDDYFYPIEDKKDDTCEKNEEDIKAITATLSGQQIEEQFPCRFEHLHFDAGLQVMNAQTALKFVRSRKSVTENGDFSRSVRQQALIVAIKEKLLQIGSISKIIPILQTIATHVKTDIDLPMLFQFLTNRQELLNSSIQSLSLSEENALETSKSQDGQFILIPVGGENNWKYIHNYIQTKINPTPTSFPSDSVLE